MAYQIMVLQSARYEVRCAPGGIVHVTLNPYNDTWAVDEDPERLPFGTKGEALDRARFIGKAPTFHKG